jgi:hypothetical protein
MAWAVLLWLVGEKSREPRTLRIADALEGLDVGPGFSYPLADLFK